MILYENNKAEKRIDVYTLKPNEKALIEYRRKNIEKQNIDELFYCFETTNKKIKELFVNAELDTRSLELNSEDWWSEITQQRFVPKSKELVQREILEKYVNGDFSSVVPTRIRTFKPDGGIQGRFQNFLVTGDPISAYSNIEKGNIYTIENLIGLSNDLCALQLLLNGRFSEIIHTGLDFSEPIQFFQAIKETEINIDELEKMMSSKLIDTDYGLRMMRKITETESILKKVKKI